MNNNQQTTKPHLEGTAKMEAFSFGVMAIILTLLVLELHVPEAMPSGWANFWPSVRPLVPKLLAFGFSFLTVAIYWVNYHNFFYTIKRTDWKLLWHNNHFLFWLALTPFTTAFIGTHPLNPPVIMVYTFVLLMCAVSFTLMIRYVFFSKGLMHEGFSHEQKVSGLNRGLLGVGLYSLAILGVFISPYFSLVILVLNPLLYFVPNALEN